MFTLGFHWYSLHPPQRDVQAELTCVADYISRWFTCIHIPVLTRTNIDKQAVQRCAAVHDTDIMLTLWSVMFFADWLLFLHRRVVLIFDFVNVFAQKSGADIRLADICVRCI